MTVSEKLKKFFLQCLEQDLPWFMSSCVHVDFMPCLVSDKSSLTRILSRISLFVKNAKPSWTIGPQNWKNHWKTIAANGWAGTIPSMVMVKIFKNHRHSIVGEKKPSPFHRLEELTIVPVYFTIYTAVKTDDGAPFNAVPSFWTAFLHFLWKSGLNEYLDCGSLPDNLEPPKEHNYILPASSLSYSSIAHCLSFSGIWRKSSFAVIFFTSVIV